MKYTLLKIYSDGRIDVSFDIDNKIQNLDNAPLDDEQSLDAWLSSYGLTYEAGLVIEAQPVVDPAITNIIGKPQEATPVEEVV